MAIRLRNVDGKLVAICAARSMPHAEDVYLDDAAHEALRTKFALDFNSEGCPERGQQIPFDEEAAKRIESQESNNPNRRWWDTVYA